VIPKGTGTQGGEIEALLQQFSQSLEEANRDLLDAVRTELRDLHVRVGALEGELRIARMQIEALQQSAPEERPADRPAPVVEPPKEPERSPEAERIAEEIRQRHKDIWQLQNAGESPAEVAKRTNRPQGEVELIMRLMRQRGTPAPGTGR
jgi:hypothetical protein